MRKCKRHSHRNKKHGSTSAKHLNDTILISFTDPKCDENSHLLKGQRGRQTQGRRLEKLSGPERNALLFLDAIDIKILTDDCVQRLCV
ncbi:hypothetical protein XELAEV_18009014mg [Xenopus laevis]|uniref:Uncharacterized protein n=1 Tax=Xenopus laevis TaxID=8355 RepID=A0A974I056_XENLA|nr:hypothetical protein XELAEV_18009014mg [Xenopus laevis]